MVKNYLYGVKSIFNFLLVVPVLLISVQTVNASHIKTGYEALKVLDYFKAKKSFTKGMKYNHEAASYGLSIVFSRNDNPFYNKDSAYRYIVIADTSWANVKERKKTKWKEYGWTRSSIDSMKIVISNLFYEEVRKQHTVLTYTTFMRDHPWARQYNSVVDTRDSLAFFETVALNSSEAYDAYVKTYPDSKYKALAEDNFYNAQYYEITSDGKLASYLEFIAEYPSSPMLDDAERNVFKLVTEPNTVEAFELFVLGYSQYKINEEAWQQYYQAYIFDYSKERMSEFLIKYPDTPVRSEVVRDLVMFDSTFLPNLGYGQYGFMNTDGQQVIETKYDFVGSFSEGLATVVLDGKYGFLNKYGQLKIKCEYTSATDFRIGRTIVEKNGKFGMIDRNNRVLLPFEFSDIGELANNLLYVSTSGKYGYADLNGKIIIQEKFDEAFDFHGPYAMVEIGEKQAMINTKGEYMIAPKFSELSPISDTLFVCTINGRKGIVSENGTFVLSPKYDQISEFRNGLALVSKSDTIEYININGEVVLSRGYRTYPNFKLKGEFNDGTAIVYKKGKYGRINTNGDPVTDIVYNNLGLGKKFIPFQKEASWGLLSLSNKVLISAKYQSIDLLDDRFVLARMNDSLGIMDVHGNIIIPFTHNSIEFLSDDLFIVRNGNHFGLYRNKNLVLSVTWDQIGMFDDEFVFLVEGQNLHYYDVKRNRLISTINAHE
jgi:hypothetical protein